MLNDVYVKLQTVVENIVSLTTYESAEEIEKAVKSARYKEDQWIGGIFDAIVSLGEIPAADVEGKRMSGVWLEQDETPNVSSDKIYRCSVCGYADEQSPSAEVPYCWHCGSKMKKMFRGGNE